MNRTLNPAYRTRANRLLSAILIATVSFAAGLVSDANAAPQIELTPIVSGINSPLAITHAGDGSGRLFITLQVGRILIHDGQQVLPSPFLDIGALVSTDGERGLLSAAFHPNYVSNGFVYVNYTDLNGDTVVARYTVSGDPNLVDPASAVILLTISQPFANHNGGQLQFGPDGYLYIGTGDGGGGGDPSNNAQNLNSLLGKMLRIDVNAGPSYGIPPNNPFIGDPAALPEIWALGLRNPWRFSFDRLTGDLWIADVGQANLEEVNIQTAGSAGGENYGWRLMEGDSCFNPASGCNDGSLTLPVLQYDHSLGCSISGGYRYRGQDHPGLTGIYFYGDFCTGRIWGATQDAAGSWAAEELLDTDFRISAFGEDEEGEMYVAYLSSNAGAVFRISEVVTAPPPATDSGRSGGGGGGCFISSIAN
jgi:glucose/arabinose dehydrogenase